VLLLIMAYRLLREFRQAFTRLDTPPCSIRHHPGSAIAPTATSLAHRCRSGAVHRIRFEAVVAEILCLASASDHWLRYPRPELCYCPAKGTWVLQRASEDNPTLYAGNHLFGERQGRTLVVASPC